MKRLFTFIVMLCTIGFVNPTSAQEVKINHTGSGLTAKGLAVEADGTIRMDGEATVWDDIRVAVVPRGSGTGNPTFTKIRSDINLYAYQFEGTSKDTEIFFEVQMPHGWKEGTTIYPHVHWASAVGSTVTTVTWGLDYTWVNINEAITIPTTISTDVAGPFTALQQKINNIGLGIVGTNKKISSILLCRLYRPAADTNTDACFLLAFDIHFEKDTEGSRLILDK